MNILKVGWIIFLVVLSVAVAGGYSVYNKQKLALQKHGKNQEELKKLEEKEKNKGTLDAEKDKDIETLKELSKQHGKWWFLHDIEDELGVEFKPLFISIGKVKLRDMRDYLYISRQMNIEATYPELIKLFENLEREKGFSVEDLKIQAHSPAQAGRHQVSFTLSSLEIKKKFLDELLEVEGKGKEKEKEDLGQFAESLILSPPWGDEQMLIVKLDKDDPFVREDVSKLLTYSPDSDSDSDIPAVVAPIDLSSRYRLEGIINFPLYRLAIIGPDYLLKEGDWLEDLQVQSIDKQKITFKQGDQEYFLPVPGFMNAGVGIRIEEVSEEETPGSIF